MFDWKQPLCESNLPVVEKGRNRFKGKSLRKVLRLKYVNYTGNTPRGGTLLVINCLTSR